MRLVSYNIQFGRGKDNRCDLGRIASEIAGADIIALQEVERFFKRSGMVDQVAIHHRAPVEGGAWCGRLRDDWSNGEALPAMPRAAVLMGDFNLLASSPLYDRLVGPRGPYGRMNNPEGFVDA